MGSVSVLRHARCRRARPPRRRPRATRPPPPRLVVDLLGGRVDKNGGTSSELRSGAACVGHVVQELCRSHPDWTSAADEPHGFSLTQWEVDVNVVAVGIVQVDLTHGKVLEESQAPFLAQTLEPLQERSERTRLEREVLQRQLGVRRVRAPHLDQMHDGVFAAIQPSAVEGKVRSWSRSQAQNVAVEGEHGVESRRAQIHVVEPFQHLPDCIGPGGRGTDFAMPIQDLPLSELERYAGRNPRPRDFDAYWEQALSELATLDPDPEWIPAKLRAPFAECFHLYFTGVRGARVHAKLLRPLPAKAEVRHPALLEFHGYTMNSGDFASKLGWVARGFVVAALDCRGQGGSSEDPGGVTGPTHSGHIVRGLLDDPQNLLFRQIFLDTVQLARVVMAMPDVDEEQIAAHGASQGGALTLACAALEPRIKRLAPVYPFLCDYLRIWEMDLAKDAYRELSDFFRRHDPIHERIDEWFEKLGYIDVQHLASRISGEVMMAIGLMDTVCPPSSQFAAYNKITAPKTRVLYPDYGHEHLPGWSDREWDFFAALER